MNAGNGGKTLALAAAVGLSGTVDCYDTDSKRLVQLAVRVARAGAHTIVKTISSEAELSTISKCGTYDTVLVDAPCSSTGVIRRRVGLRQGMYSICTIPHMVGARLNSIHELDLHATKSIGIPLCA
jgi:16S rRNA C967 or C1407 C5-methylase (RsmB/RsmF family)